MVRLAKNKDIPEILELLEEIREVHHNLRPDLFKESEYKYRTDELEKMIVDENTPIFVYEDENKILGYVMADIIVHMNHNVIKDMKTLYIDDFCVKSGYRGRNIGHKIYDYVLNYAKDIGCHNITLNVWTGNDNAIKFYESLGLKPQKTCMEKIL